MERELARVMVSTNRIATVVANEWKDENNRVMPVKKWLEERKMFQVLLTTQNRKSSYKNGPHSILLCMNKKKKKYPFSADL